MNKNQNIAVIGLGYVGLPLSIEFGKKFRTVGYDINQNRINELSKGIDRTLETTKSEIESAKKLIFTSQINEISNCNIYIITVPTPVDKHNVPDMSPLASASKSVGSVLNKNDLIIYESTVYPGATEEFCVPILEEESNLQYNKDFFCGYSPERINPGDKNRTLTKIKKVTSGSNDKIATYVDSLYSSIIPSGTYKASSIAVAEAAKVIENIQRDVNIALINELSIIFNKLNIDTIEVLEAAGTKWNFLPFRPGLVGGHCIGVDPFYLTYKASEIDYNPEIIIAGRRINESMPNFIVENTLIEMSKAGLNPYGSNLAILGLTFKENCPDLRNTKVINIYKQLKRYGCKISITDQYANIKEAKELFDIDLLPLEKIENMDAIIIAVPHDDYKNILPNDWLKLLNKNGVIIDIKSIFNSTYFSNLDISHWRL